MFVKRKLLNIAVLGSLGLAGTAQAVYLGEDGTGEALVYPYYTVRDNYFTLISVVNTTDSAKAVKVRFLEGKNSREVLDFNLYLSANDVWTGAIETTASGAKLSTTDKSCTVPAISTSQGGAGSVDFRNFAYTATNPDGEDASLNRTREGYIEILEMGELSTTATITRSGTGTITVTNAVTHVSGTPADCGAMVKGWATGGAFVAPTNTYVLEPSGGLFGGGSIIRTDIGTDYTYDAVALDDWSNVALHTGPGTLSPSLASTSPDVSQIFVGGGVIASTWASQIQGDAVSAVLMRSAVMNEYTVETIVNAGTDWIVTFPTKRFYVGIDSTGATDPDSNQRFFERPFSDDFWVGGACEQVDLVYFDREEQHPTGSVDFSPEPPSGRSSLCWEVNVVTFNNGGVLASELATNQNVDVGSFQNGWMHMSFLGNTLHSSQDSLTGGSFDGVLATGATDITERARRMISDDGDTYFGLPVVGFMVQEFVKGDGSLDNYGGNFVHKYQRNVSGTAAP